MARKTATKRRRRRQKTTLPLAVIGGFLPLGKDLVSDVSRGDWHSVGWRSSVAFTGYNIDAKGFDWNAMRKYAVPMVMGSAVHKVAGQWLGVNRLLASAKIPLLRI